jgi:GNAT superfamily N-acetyltransferase
MTWGLAMTIQVDRVDGAEIAELRGRHVREMNCQVTKDSIHGRPGWTIEYLLRLGGRDAGYGSVAVAGPWKDKPTLYEFYVEPECRGRVFDLFEALRAAAGPVAVETQSNAVLLTAMLHTFARDVFAEAILFHDRITTALAPPAGATFRTATEADGLDMRPEQLASHGVVEMDGGVAASGGILYHYNRPYGDIYMEVAELYRRRGIGAYLVQELKRVCRELGSVPAARCNVGNAASRKTLQKAGFVPCGNILVGSLSAPASGA